LRTQNTAGSLTIGGTSDAWQISLGNGCFSTRKCEVGRAPFLLIPTLAAVISITHSCDASAGQGPAYLPLSAALPLGKSPYPPLSSGPPQLRSAVEPALLPPGTIRFGLWEQTFCAAWNDVKNAFLFLERSRARIFQDRLASAVPGRETQRWVHGNTVQEKNSEKVSIYPSSRAVCRQRARTS